MSDISGHYFEDIDTCMWNVIITLSSAGYGDIYPKTFFGRIVGMLICFWGVFIISIFVVTVTDLLEFSLSENKSFEFLMKMLNKTQLKKGAVELIQSANIQKKLLKQEPRNDKKILSSFRHFRSKHLAFKATATVVRS